MLNIEKTNGKLGEEVNKYLEEKGVQTPILKSNNLETDTKIERISKQFEIIMQTMGLDLTDDSLEKTPMRVAKMFVKELFWGLDPNNFPKIMTVENKMSYDELVIERDIQVTSACEHHFVTIWGKAHIAYLPKNKVLGLSKLNRIVEYFSRRPQIQERLTEQIYYALQYLLETDDIAVVIDAEHYCVKARGVEDINSSTITSKMGGIFKDKPSIREEFMGLIRK